MLPQQGYPPQQGGFPPPPGYPQQGAFPPPQGFPQQGAFPPPPGFPQGGFAPPFAAPSKKLSGFERINKDGLYIKQKVDIAEIASGCERQNSYFIHNIDKDGGKLGLETLRAKEESNWCARQCLAGNCRPYKVTVQLRDADLKVHNSAFLEIERPCTCTCLCFARPVVNITHVEDGTRTYLGKIVQPWKCCNCDLNLEVYNASNALTYKVVAKCCQTGVLCGMYPFSPCQTVDFAVETAGGRVVSSFQKKTAGICASMTSNSDNYVVTFPSGASVEDKALLLATALFADYQWFEKRVGITF